MISNWYLNNYNVYEPTKKNSKSFIISNWLTFTFRGVYDIETSLWMENKLIPNPSSEWLNDISDLLYYQNKLPFLDLWIKFLILKN